MNDRSVNRPVLRWHGGKWMMAPWIISQFPAHRIYTETFGGAASVLLRKPRSYAEIYNDVDGDVVNFFRILRDPATAVVLKQMLKHTPFARAEFEESYDPTRDPVERARRLVIRSFMGFGSNSPNTARKTGFRVNSNRSGTTPSHDFAHYPDSLDGAVERLSGVVIENREATEIMRQHDSPDTLHYVDPPYVHASRKVGQAGNYAHEMTDAQHIELAKTILYLEGMVILSGYQSDLYNSLYCTWESIPFKTHADGASPRVERLWFNPSAWAKRPQEALL